ncbi:MAG TPA: ankyrin repeat domain-containing protein [Steroidobacteraceae bacterium]|nr:ankyrin repeat domain-containing protein [Steroidobacteraceae bacterium]
MLGSGFMRRGLRSGGILALGALLALSGLSIAVAGDAAPSDETASSGSSSPLIEAAKAGDQKAALALVEKGADVNARAPDGTTALMWAAHNDEVDLTRALLKRHADFRAVNLYGTSAMQEAATGAYTQVLKLLLDAGADVDSPNAEHQTALMAVARTGKVEAAKLLLSRGAAINAVENWGGQTALMWAAAQSQPQMIKLLIEHHAKVNLRSAVRNWPRRVTAEGRPLIMDVGGLSALAFAARQDCIDCVKELVKGGADLNEGDPDDTTPLIIALMNMHFDLAKVLIDAGADVNKWDFFGDTPLYVAVDMNTLPTGGRADLPSTDILTGYDIAKLLLEKGANPNAQLKLRPPYRNGVFDRGGDQVLSTGATPLLLAAKVGDVRSVKLLLQYHALVNLPNAEGVTPLMAAAGVGQSFNPTRGRYKTDAEAAACVKAIHEAGGDIAAEDAQKETALFGAAKQGWDEAVKELVAYGSELQPPDRFGLRPIDYARGNYYRAFLEPQPAVRTSTVALLTQYITDKTGKAPVIFPHDVTHIQRGVGAGGLGAVPAPGADGGRGGAGGAGRGGRGRGGRASPGAAAGAGAAGASRPAAGARPAAAGTSPAPPDTANSAAGRTGP